MLRRRTKKVDKTKSLQVELSNPRNEARIIAEMQPTLVTEFNGDAIIADERLQRYNRIHKLDTTVLTTCEVWKTELRRSETVLRAFA
jgi:hypothetical protein